MELNKPKPFTPSKNQIEKDWQIWKKEFLAYLRLSGGYEKFSEETRALLLINLMGTEAVKAMDIITFENPNDKDDMDILLIKFDEYFDPPANEIEERFKFFSRLMYPNETIDDYVLNLKEMAKNCNFGTQLEKFVMDMVIRSMNNYLRQLIFKEEDITLTKIIENHKEYIVNSERIKEVSENMAKSFYSESKNDDTSEADNANSDQTRSKPCWRCNTHHRLGYCPAYGKICSVCNKKDHLNGLCRKASINIETNARRICSKCGWKHPFRQCPAFNETCNKCSKKGHFAALCKETISSNNAELENCLWCESKHPQGQCKHDTNCTTCDHFPHKICFNCKSNPHNKHCYFKTIITLPVKLNTNDSNIDYVKTNQQKNSLNNLTNTQTETASKIILIDCAWCGLHHENEKCVHEKNCRGCNIFPHKVCSNCKNNPHLDSCYKQCRSCNNNPHIFCYECKRRKQENSSGFAHVQPENVSRHFQQQSSKSSKNKPKSKDDSCNIS